MVWPLIGVWVATLVVSYALRPKVKINRPDATPVALEDFDFPTAEDGREIPVLFGTRETSGPNVVWYGDLGTTEITESYRVPRGGLSGVFGRTRRRTQVVGFNYFLGAHMGMVHGPVDSLNRIRVSDDVVWLGLQEGGGSFDIDEPEVFGGEDGEGGIEGTFSFANGEPLQLPSQYLRGNLGTPIPAFRGVSCGILEHMFVSTNTPYLKPWAFYLTRTDVTTYGVTQWYVEKARIGSLPEFSEIEGMESEGGYTVLAVYDGTSTDKGDFRFDPIEGIEDYEVLIVGAGGRTHTFFGLSGTYASGGAGGGQVIHRSVKITEPLINTSMSGSSNDTKIYPAGRTISSVNAAVNGESSFLRLPGETIEAKGGSGASLSSGYTGSGGGAGNTTVESGFCGTGGTCGGGGVYNNSINAGFGGGGSSQELNGENAVANKAGDGADGVDLSDFYPGYGDGGWFGGGGGGGAANNAGCGTAGRGGKGGGGDGHDRITCDPSMGSGGTDNTGGGGGGGNNQNTADGGSGIIIIAVDATQTSDTTERLGETGCADMNPAHIIRECLTDKEWGMGYSEADIDDDSFHAAADTLYDEQMGISMLWQRENTIEAFVQDIIRHIDAALYVDRRTGKFVLKLIRDDYSESDLITLGPDEIERVENYKRPAFGDLVNSVTVIYEDCDDGLTDAYFARKEQEALDAELADPSCIRYGMFEKGSAADGELLIYNPALVFQRRTCLYNMWQSAKDIYHRFTSIEDIRADMIERLQSFVGCEYQDQDPTAGIVGELVPWEIVSITESTSHLDNNRGIDVLVRMDEYAIPQEETITFIVAPDGELYRPSLWRVPCPDCGPLPENTRMMGTGFPRTLTEVSIEAGETLVYDMLYDTDTAQGRYETVPTSSNNALRETWISRCPGGDPIPGSRCSSSGLELTTIRWSVPLSSTACQIIKGQKHYFNVRSSVANTFYATGTVIGD